MSWTRPLRPRRTVCLVLHRRRSARHDVRRHPLRLLVRRESAVPVCGRPRVSRLLPAPVRRDRAPASPSRLDVQHEPLAGRLRGGSRCRRDRRVRTRRGRRQLDARKPAGRADEHGLSDRRHSLARAPRLRLLGDALAARPCVDLDRRGPRLQHGGRRALPLRDRLGDVRRGHVPRSRLATVARSRGACSLATPRPCPSCPAPRSRHARDADRLWFRGHRGAPHSLVPARPRDRARARKRDDRARSRSNGTHAPGEHAPAGGQPA